MSDLDFEKLPRFKNDRFQILLLISEWAAAYEVSLEEVQRQIPIAHAWCQANPKAAPKRLILRFLGHWMGRAHKVGNLVKHRAKTLYSESRPDADDLVTPEMFAELRRRLSRPKSSPI